MVSSDNFSTGEILSAHGTPIGYRTIGSGPGLVLVHGALQSSLNFTRLAKALANNFTVFIPDRRGRGLSGPYHPSDNLTTEANDIATLARNTGARNIFGLSSGAIITLKAALLEPSLQKVALFEPPIPVRGISFDKLNVRYTSAIQKGHPGKAFLAILKGTGDGSLMTKLPVFITAPLLNRMIKDQSKNLKPGKIALEQLLHTFSHDQVVAAESVSLIKEAANLKAEVLLLGGTKSQKFLGNALDELQIAMPTAKRIAFEKEGHLATDNTGNPEKVAIELIKFFDEAN